jgi:hypothetical protein
MNHASANDVPIRRHLLALVGVTVLYLAGYFAWYGTTVLGQYPVLDGKEILHLAKLIASGDFGGQAFFRAPVYPGFLALLLKIGVPFDGLLGAARMLNGVCHLATTVLLFFTALRLWKSPRAALFAGVLFGINPVALYFAGDPFDISMSMSWLMAGLYFAVSFLDPEGPGRPRHAFLAGLFLGIASLTRPQLMIVAVAWPMVVLIAAHTSRWRLAALAIAGIAVDYAAVALVNRGLSGDYTVVPTCADYQLYVANKEGVNGRYYTQTVRLRNTDPFANPVMLEAEILYMQATGTEPPVDYVAMNRYWRERFYERVLENPLSWVRLLAWKAYYALNNYEQHNNKTYVLHKERSPWLRFNPVGWWLFLVLGVGGAVIGFRLPASRCLLFFVALYGAGLVLFLVSDRYRMPMVPMLAVLCGGWLVTGPKPWRVLAPVLAATAVLTLSTFGKANDRSTVVEDYILMGRAALAIGRDDEAALYGGLAMKVHANRPEPHEIVAVADYNTMLAGLPALPSRDELARRRDRCASIRTFTDAMEYQHGVYAWLLGDEKDAVSGWHRLVDEGSKERPSALAALILTRHARPDDREKADRLARDGNVLLMLAKAAAGDTDALNALKRSLPPEAVDAQVRALQSLFRPQL